jgi:hypothetical protein
MDSVVEKNGSILSPARAARRSIPTVPNSSLNKYHPRIAKQVPPPQIPRAVPSLISAFIRLWIVEAVKATSTKTQNAADTQMPAGWPNATRIVARMIDQNQWSIRQSIGPIENLQLFRTNVSTMAKTFIETRYFQ